MAGFLAILSAVFFALAAALQQRGTIQLADRGEPVEGLGSLLRLVWVPVWLLGTAILLLGYLTQGAALDRGRLVVIQPLIVSTIVWALPLGHWLTNQTVTRRQVAGAAVVVVGLTLFVMVGDPDDGRDSAPTGEYLAAIAAVGALAAALVVWGRRAGAATTQAAALGAAAGVLFGLSATFTKTVVEELHVSVGEVLSNWSFYGLIGFGAIAFVIQQLSLAPGRLAPAMASVSVANPVVSVLLGILLFEERLTRPAWHVVVASLALLAALWGAVMITTGNEE